MARRWKLDDSKMIKEKIKAQLWLRLFLLFGSLWFLYLGECLHDGMAFVFEGQLVA